MATIFVLLLVSIAIHAMNPFAYHESRFDSLHKRITDTLPKHMLKIHKNPMVVSYMGKRAPGTFLNWALSSYSPWQLHNTKPYLAYRLPASNRPISFVATMGKRKDKEDGASKEEEAQRML